MHTIQVMYQVSGVTEPEAYEVMRRCFRYINQHFTTVEIALGLERSLPGRESEQSLSLRLEATTPDAQSSKEFAHFVARLIKHFYDELVAERG